MVFDEKNRPRGEMTVGELKRELKRVVRRIDELEKLEDDPELKELLKPGISGAGFTDLLGMAAVAKMMFLFARYFDLPPEALAYKPKEGR